MDIDIKTTVDLETAKFQAAFFNALEKNLLKSGAILRRNLSTALRTTGKSPPASPKGSKIPYNRTGTLARSWFAEPNIKRRGGVLITVVSSNVRYAATLVKRTDSGRRNYMDGRLSWRRKTNKMIISRLDAKRLVREAVRSFKK